MQEAEQLARAAQQRAVEERERQEEEERLRLEEGQHARGINMADEFMRLLSVRPSARHGQIVDHVARSRITSSPALAAIGLQLAPRSLAVVAKIFPAPLLFARNRGRVLELEMQISVNRHLDLEHLLGSLQFVLCL